MAGPIIPTGDIFSKRQKKLRGEDPDVYVYDDLPNPLRQQIVNILDEVFDACANRYGPNWETKQGHYEDIVKILRDEHGTNRLAKPDISHPGLQYQTELENFILHAEDVEKTIDSIEVAFRLLHHLCRRVYTHVDFSKAEDKLNFRFNEHGIGYQFTDGKPIRIDSELIHAEAVKPAFCLLRAPHYAGAQLEFLAAHEHYRKGNAKEALDTCLKAFESVMKAICDKRGWQYHRNATATPLIQVCFNNGLIPQPWQSQYGALRSLLESGVPTVRNEWSGHGQGTIPKTVPNHIVAYMLHMTASAIVFLAEAERNLP